MRFKLVSLILLAFVAISASLVNAIESGEQFDGSPTTTESSNTTTDDSTITTEPSNTTTDDSIISTEPSNTTTEPSNTTTDDSIISTEPSNTTTDDLTITTEPSNTTTDDSIISTEPSNTTTEPSNTTTDNSTITTEPSNTTTEPSNTTTEASNTTTEASNTTTEASNTTTEASNTTIEASTTTTKIPPTTSETPESWQEYPAQVSNEDGKPPCIFSKMSITLKVKYQKTDNTTEEGTVSVPEQPTVSGTCGTTVSTMILTWTAATALKTRYIRSSSNVYAKEENEISFVFKKDNSSISVEQIDVDIFLDEDNFPDARDTKLNATVGKDLNLFATSPTGSKYICNDEIVRSTEDNNVQLTFKNVNIVAFNEDEDLSKKSEEYCQRTESANVGAIVGGVIAALVVVGIVGFIIWRRRRNSYSQSEVA